MTMKNKYAKRSKISEKKFREILRYFALDLNASQITKRATLNRNTVNRYLIQIRIKIAEPCQPASPLNGEVEIDESYFGARRIIRVEEAEEPLEKQSFWVSSNETERSTLKSSQIAGEPLCKRLSGDA